MQQFIAKMKDSSTVDMCLFYPSSLASIVQALKLHQWEEDEYGYLQV